MLLTKFLEYHIDASIEDLEFLYEFELIGDDMTTWDYMNAADYLRKAAKNRLEGDRIMSWFERAFTRMKKKIEEVEF